MPDKKKTTEPKLPKLMNIHQKRQLRKLGATYKKKEEKPKSRVFIWPK